MKYDVPYNISKSQQYSTLSYTFSLAYKYTYITFILQRYIFEVSFGAHTECPFKYLVQSSPLLLYIMFSVQVLELMKVVHSQCRGREGEAQHCTIQHHVAVVELMALALVVVVRSHFLADLQQHWSQLEEVV